MLSAFTNDDPEMIEGLQRFYAEAKELPPEKSPYTAATWDTMQFAEQAYEASQKVG